MRRRVAEIRLRSGHRVLLRRCRGEALDHQRGIRQPGEFLSVLRIQGQSGGREDEMRMDVPGVPGTGLPLLGPMAIGFRYIPRLFLKEV